MDVVMAVLVFMQKAWALKLGKKYTLSTHSMAISMSPKVPSQAIPPSIYSFNRSAKILPATMDHQQQLS